MTETQTEVSQNKPVILLTLVIGLDNLEPISKVCRFPGMVAKPFDGDVKLPGEYTALKHKKFRNFLSQ